MLKKMLSVGMLMVAVAGTTVMGQVQPGAVGGGGGFGNMSPEQQQAMQEMQDMGRQIMQNMQNAGIDMMEFAQRMQQGMMDGSLDADALQQELIDKGVIDREMMGKIQKSVTRIMMMTLKERLAATDEEWTALEPRLQAVVVAQMEAGTVAGVLQPGRGGMGGMLRGMGGGAGSEVSKAMRELKAAVKDQGTAGSVLAQKLEAFRQARERAQVKVEKAEGDLRSVLTLKQEGILEGMGFFN